MNDHAPTANHLLRHAELFLKSLKPGPLAIAVSGGSDSLGVLLAICEANSSDREIICFTVNHGLRAESAAEARIVSEICNALGVEHQTLNWVDEKPKFGIQNAARQARYRLLADACAKKNAVGLVTGHTQDDQLETVTMRASRNASDTGKGLSGMAAATLFFNQMWVLRPFLTIGKDELQQFLDTRNQTWIEDPSNQDDKFERVRIRKQADFVLNQSKIEDAQALRLKTGVKAAEYLSKHCNVLGGLLAEVDIKLNDMPSLLRAFEILIDVIGGRNRTLSSNQMEKFSQFIQAKRPTTMTLGRVLIEKKLDILILQRENRNLDAMEIGAQSRGIWDGRFRIENRNQEKVLVVTANSDANGFPPKLHWMSENLDDLLDIKGDDPYISISRYVNRFDEVLSLFDMSLATEIAKLFEIDEFKAPPFIDDL